jgi:arylsulfatase A-like enzyme
MTRRSLLLASGAPALLAQRRRPPNVIFLITDDQGYGDLSCHGNPWLKTPHLDRLHSQSIRFTDHHSDPLCAPTRAGLLTGQYALSNGVTAATGGWSILRPGVPTMADLFRGHGYRTAVFGKWHLGENHPMRPPERGFDESVVCRSGGIAQAADYWGNRYFDDHYYTQNEPKPYKGYCTDVFFDLAKGFIERNRERPFFLYLPTNAPHDPYLVDEKYSKPYADMGVPEPACNFYGMIANIDENVGKLRAHLDRLGLTDNTIFVFMTDNGSSAGVPRPGQETQWKGYRAGMRMAKGSPYEGGHRVPLFVYWPAGEWTGGREINELTTHLDLLPTLTELCGVPVPSEHQLDGHSLVPLVRGGAYPRDRFHFIEHHQVRREGLYRMEQPQPWMNSVALTRRWRLVNGKELYDLRSDPGQAVNVADKYPEMARTLSSRYLAWRNRMYTGFRQWTRIPVGGAVDPVELTCFDWHGEIVPSNQEMVSNYLVGNGTYALFAEQPGTYEIVLRQRPSYVPSKLRAERARVYINGRELPPKDVAAGSESVAFRARLAKGNVNLGTELIEGSRERGAYYVDVRLAANR